MSWVLDVLRAFRDVLDADRPDHVPAAHIGWPDQIAFASAGPWRPFVWFASDQAQRDEDTETHRLTVVVGVVLKQDPSLTDQTELEQALQVWDQLRSKLAAAAADRQSSFNRAFLGVAEPDAEAGAHPSDGKDFDGVCTLGERYLVTASIAISPAP